MDLCRCSECVPPPQAPGSLVVAELPEPAKRVGILGYVDQKAEFPLPVRVLIAVVWTLPRIPIIVAKGILGGLWRVGALLFPIIAAVLARHLFLGDRYDGAALSFLGAFLGALGVFFLLVALVYATWRALGPRPDRTDVEADVEVKP